MEDPQSSRGVDPSSLLVKVLCCVCGIPIVANSANTCASCLASSSDITRGISTESTLHQCRGCQRWHKDAGKWIACELESRELMALCLGKVSGLKASKHSGQQVRLVDASWIWTEPHSMRLKVRLTIQKEVQLGTILQQSFNVEFIVRNQQCLECQAQFRQGSWKSLVQVRQRVSHKRTFLYLEQLILKHGAHRGCLSIETFRDGMDFYFPDRGKAARFMSFLENVVPIKVKTSKKLIGTDDKSNISNYKYTNLVEICPLCKDDLLYLPEKLARKLGNMPQLVLIKNISNLIHLLDPLSGQVASMSADQFWRDPIRPIVTAARSRMTRYVVLGKEPIVLERNASRRTASRRQRNCLASLTMAREGDLGVNDKQFEELSHVGYLMKSGDVCVGYDLTETQLVDDEAEGKKARGKIPDVIVLRKLYGGVAAGEADAAKKRVWQLKRLEVKEGESTTNARSKKNDADADDMDEEDFMREVEADKEMRGQMNLYKRDVPVAAEAGATTMEEDAQDAQPDDDDEDDQEIKLDELLDSLALDAGPDGDDDEDDTFDQAGVAEGDRASKDGIAYVGRDDSRLMRDKEAAIPLTEFAKEFSVDDPDL